MRVGSAVSPIPGLIRDVFFFVKDILVAYSVRVWGFFRQDNVQSSSRMTDVLILRLDAIGDFIIWLDSAKELRSVYPRGEYRLVLLVNELLLQMAVGTKLFDQVWSVDKRKYIESLSYRLKVLNAVNKSCFSILIQPRYSREFIFEDAITWVCRAKEKIGYEGDCSNMPCWQKKVTDKWYSKLIHNSLRQLHEIDRNVLFMQSLGAGELVSSVPSVPSFLRWPPRGFDFSEYFVVAPGASITGKQWELEKFMDVAGRIYLQTGWACVLVGSENERVLGDRMLKHTDIPMHNWIGKTDLSELTGIVSRAKLVLCNDSASVHIAVAVSTPSVVILGGGHFGRFLPYGFQDRVRAHLPTAVYHEMTCFGCGWSCIYKSKRRPYPCIEKVSADDVWLKTSEIIERVRHSEKSVS